MEIAQKMPKDRITTRTTITGSPQSYTFDKCLDVIERIQALSDKSPGAPYKAEALKITFSVYLWMQQWAMAHPVISKDGSGPVVVSYQERLEDKGKI